MYKQIALALACLAGTAAGAYAQTAQANAPVTVAVQATLGLTETGATDFGTVNNNAGTVTVDPAVPANGTTAMFSAAGTPGAHIAASWSGGDVALFSTDRTATISFTPKVSTASASTDQASSAALTDGSTVTLNSTGNAYFWLGGSVTIANNQKPSSYTGTFTLQVTYN